MSINIARQKMLQCAVLTKSHRVGWGSWQRVSTSREIIAGLATLPKAGSSTLLRRNESFKLDPESSPRHVRGHSDGGVNEKRTVIITGASGNLGSKAAKHLLSLTNAKYNLVLLDASPCPEDLKFSDKQLNGHSVEYIQCDLAHFDKKWADKVKSSWACVLLAARNPQPDSSPKDVLTSMLINSNILEACALGNVDRVVFASSNHVVGGMLWDKGKIEPDARPRIGTKFQVAGVSLDSTLYASAKAAAEAQLVAMTEAGRLQRSIILRVGFCQPGENKRGTLPETGNPNRKPKDDNRALTDKEKENEKFIMDWWNGM